MPIRTQSAKAKGRKLQQWVRDTLIGYYPHLLGHITSTSMGAGGEDVGMSPTARAEIPLSFECKSRKSFSIYKVLDQAKANCPANSQPVLIIKQDRSKPLAILDAEYFFEVFCNDPTERNDTQLYDAVDPSRG